MKKVSARWVLRMLSDVQKAIRVDASTTLLCLFSEYYHDFISRFLTVNQIWLHHFDGESQVQSMAWKHIFTSQEVSRCRVGSQSYGDCR